MNRIFLDKEEIFWAGESLMPKCFPDELIQYEYSAERENVTGVRLSTHKS